MGNEKKRSGIRIPPQFEPRQLPPRPGHAAEPPQPPSHHQPPPDPLSRRFGRLAFGAVTTATGVAGFVQPIEPLDANPPKPPADPPLSPQAAAEHQAVAEHVATVTNREGDDFDNLLREVLKDCEIAAISECLKIVGKRIARALFHWKQELAENADAEELMAELKALRRDVADLKTQSDQMPAVHVPMEATSPPEIGAPGGAGGLFFFRRPLLPGHSATPMAWLDDQDAWSAVPLEKELWDLKVLSSLMDTTEATEPLADAATAPPIPDGDVFGRFGQEICRRLAGLARGALCGKDGLAAKVGDASVEDIAKAIRAAAGTSELSRVAVYAIVGAAVVISNVGLEHYCKGYSGHA